MVYRIGEAPGVWAIGTAGISMYWVVFICMTVAAVIFAAITFRRPLHQRSHGYITTAIVTIAAIAYFVMAAHGGSALTANPYGDTRDIYYARYVDWFFTTPLLLLDLLLLTGMPIGVALWIVLADIAMIMLGLFGALSTRVERWAFYAVSCCFFFIVLWGLLGPGMRGVRAQNAPLARTYMGLAAYLAILWFGYPIVWGFAEGACVISVSAEAIAYGILDFFAKVGFGAGVMACLPVISNNPVTGGSMLTNSVNSPFTTGNSFDAAEKGGNTRLMPGTGPHSTAATGPNTGFTGTGTGMGTGPNTTTTTTGATRTGVAAA